MMTEVADVVTDFWLEEHGFQVAKATGNKGFRRLSEKIGMRVVATKESGYMGGRLPSETWQMTAAERRMRRVAAR